MTERALPTETALPTDTAGTSPETIAEGMVTAASIPVGVTTRTTRRPALSPSRAGDFKQCPLLYRFRAVDRLPEPATRAQVRGTVVHSVLETLYGLPRDQRVPATAKNLLAPSWTTLRDQRDDLDHLFTGPDDPELAEWLASAETLIDSYFRLEDPRRLEPEACELLVETELDSGVLLRGYIDRLDVAPTGEIRVVDYKTGVAPREIGEAKAMFQMKFYAVALWRIRGVVPRQLLLMYLSDGQALTYTPDEDELRRFERTLVAIWRAILQAGRTGDFRPNPGRLCGWCSFKPLCPSFDGTPPPYPGWPEPDIDETPLDRAD